MLLILSQASVAYILWYLTGDAGLPTRIATAVVPFLLLTPVYVAEFIATPPRLVRQMEARAIAAEQSLSSANKVPDIKAIHNLLMRYGAHFLKMRGKRGASIEEQKLWAREFLADMETIFGPEMKLNLVHKYPTLTASDPTQADMDRAMHTLSGAMGDLQEGLTENRVSKEADDVNGYVKKRLAEFRGMDG